MKKVSPPKVVGGALFLWSLAYCVLVYFSFVSSSAEKLEILVEQGTIKPEYAAYILTIPDWVRALTIALATIRLVGSIGVILNKMWAFYAFAFALFLTLVIIYRGFVLAGIADVIRPSQIGVELGFIAISMFAVWYSFRLRKKLAIK